MDDRNVGHGTVVIDHDSGAGMGVVLGVVLAIVVALTVMWFAFGANMMRGAPTGSSQSNPNNGTNINITVPKPDINISVPNQQPVSPSQPPAAEAKP